MSRRLRRLLLTWTLLMALVALELGSSFLPLGHSIRPLLLIPAVGMIAVVAMVAMEIGRGSVLIRLFAVAGLLWLTILLGLGSLDVMTRADYPLRAADPL